MSKPQIVEKTKSKENCKKIKTHSIKERKSKVKPPPSQLKAYLQVGLGCEADDDDATPPRCAEPVCAILRRSCSGVSGIRRGSPRPTIMRESREVRESLPCVVYVLRLEMGVAATNSMKYFSCSKLDEASPLDVPETHTLPFCITSLLHNEMWCGLWVAAGRTKSHSQHTAYALFYANKASPPSISNTLYSSMLPFYTPIRCHVGAVVAVWVFLLFYAGLSCFTGQAFEPKENDIERHNCNICLLFNNLLTVLQITSNMHTCVAAMWFMCNTVMPTRCKEAAQLSIPIE